MDDVTTSFDEFGLLDGSVPDLAATLTTQAEQDAEDANISFLRGELIEEREEIALEREEDQRRRRRRPVEVEPGRHRYTVAEYHHMDELDDPNAMSRSTTQEYRGWAPGTSDDDDHLSYLDPPPSFSARLADEQGLRRDGQDLRERMRNRRRRDHMDARLAERSPRYVDTRNTSGEEPSPNADNSPSLQSLASESSLRTTALLQAVRRNSQFSPQSRNHLQRFILERERNSSESDEQRDPPTSFRPTSLSPSQRQQIELREARVRQEIRFQQELLSEHQRRLERLAEEEWHLRNRGTLPENTVTDSQRRRYWQVAPAHPNIDHRSIGSTIKYLGRLRWCESDLEGHETAEEIGFDHEERSRPDFLTDTTLIPPPPESSWLQIGGILSGSQSAITPPSSTAQYTSQYTPQIVSTGHRSRVRHPTMGASTARTTSPIRNYPSSSTTLAPRTNNELSQHPSSSNPPPPPATTDEHWPVKVTFQSVNYNTMTLSGTMEAFDVPDKSSPTRESTITTYLEGEIIDFNRHTLETKSYKADARTDAMYWFRLPPLRDLKDEDAMIRALTSQTWLREELMKNWILMRWKG